MLKKYYAFHKEILQNFFWRTLQIFGKQGMNFLIFVMCAKLLTNYDFGVYSYILAVVFFLVMFGDFGISAAASKFVAEYNITDQDKLKSVLVNSTLLIALLTFAVSVFVLVFGRWYFTEKYLYVLFLLPLVFMAPMTSLYDGIYKGLKKFKTLAIVTLISGFVSIYFIYCLIKTHGLIGALISQNVFYLILLLGLAIGYKEFHFKINVKVIRDISHYSFYFGLSLLGYYLFSRIDILILGHFGYITEIANYELLNKIFLIILIPFGIFGDIVSPNMTQIYCRGDYRSVYEKYSKYLKYSFIISGMVYALLFFAVPLLIKLFFPKYYTDLLFAIFVPTFMGYFFASVSAPIKQGVIAPCGFVKLMGRANLYLALLNLVLCLILVYPFKFLGVIYATAVTQFVGIIYLQVELRKALKRDVGSISA